MDLTRPTRRRDWSEQRWAWLFAAPSLVLLSGLALLPIGASLWLSLHRRLPIFGINDFVGLHNYALLLRDGRFWSAWLTTLYFTAVSVALEVVLGLGIALLLRGSVFESPGSTSAAGSAIARGYGRVVMLVPWAIPTVVSARIWEWLYQPDYGLLNYALTTVGLSPVNWLGSPVAAIHAAILMDVWKATPFVALLLLGGLQSIPRELYLAARVDGAGAWTTFFRITVPLLMPAVVIVLVFRTMDAFRVFDAVYVLTGGGPGNSTETVSIYAYKMLFQTLQFGYGAAIATMVFVSVMLMSVGYLVLLRARLEKAGLW